jgi:hypothetical protein
VSSSGRRSRGRWTASALWGLAVVAIVTGCGGSSEQGPPAREFHAGAISTTIPTGWRAVRLRNVPGADVPLEVASFPLRGAVRSVCDPGHGIVGQIPPGDALVQLLDDTHAVRRQRFHRRGLRSEFPPLRRSFYLGRPESHECGEAYNTPFRKSGRAFQLRIWTASRSRGRPWIPTRPGHLVRRQVGAVVNRLRVKAKAGATAFTRQARSLNGARSQRTRARLSALRRCSRATPATKGPVGGEWNARVRGLGCGAAGRFIFNRFLGSDLQTRLLTTREQEMMLGRMSCDLHPRQGGWRVDCARGNERLAFLLSP